MAQSLTYLLDTNIWLERLLDQDRADEVRRLLDEVSSDRLFITEQYRSMLEDNIDWLTQSRPAPDA